MTVMRSLTAVRSLLIALAALSLLAVSPAAGAQAKVKRVPPNFMGVVGDGPLLSGDFDLGGQLDRMVPNGVQSMRTVFNWAAAQPYESFTQVPPDQLTRFRNEDGVPTDWSPSDHVVLEAAQRRISILPVIMVAPVWAARHPGEFASPPSDPKEYASFCGSLARRYGPGGSFWTEHPEISAMPLRSWQVWNEPSFNTFWSDQPFAEDYVELLRDARIAVKSVDPKATVVLAGLPNKSWTSLEKIYKAGGRKFFDVAAFHPFTAKVDGVKTILERDRKVMAKYKDSRKPLWVTELSWTSSKGKTTINYGNEQTEKGQGKMLAAAFNMLAKQRGRLRIGRAYWYTWLSRDRQRDYPFDWAGLSKIVKGKIKGKPALTSFKRTALSLQGCRSKKGRADRCAS
ncbi:MAG: polysaccharide biosynthesis protein PslG [Thermoleophilaceae bacterium]|nr:polysaccharide biosynthesis protein PslG [Thermoleophilaceae bacterium]